MSNKYKEIQRLQFLQELQGRELMRKAIRKAIHTVLERRNQEDYERLIREQDEIRLRSKVRKILAE